MDSSDKINILDEVKHQNDELVVCNKSLVGKLELAAFLPLIFADHLSIESNTGHLDTANKVNLKSLFL